CRLSTDCATSSAVAARLKLPASATPQNALRLFGSTQGSYAKMANLVYLIGCCCKAGRRTRVVVQEVRIMEWLPMLLDDVVRVLQVSAGLALVYGAYLSISYDDAARTDP